MAPAVDFGVEINPVFDVLCTYRQLTMTRADGLPPNPYNPATAGASVTPGPVKGPSPVKGPAPAVLPTPRVPTNSKGPAPAVLPPVAPPHPQHGHNTKNIDEPVRIRFKMSAR